MMDMCRKTSSILNEMTTPWLSLVSNLDIKQLFRFFYS